MAARPLMPRWLGLWFGTHSFKRAAKKHGVRKNMYDAPHE